MWQFAGRQTDLPDLKDTGKRGLWMEAELERRTPGLPFSCPKSLLACFTVLSTTDQLSLLRSALSITSETESLTVNKPDSVNPDSWERDSASVSLNQLHVPNPSSCGQGVGSCL